MSHEKIKSRIRKLLDLAADDSASQGEVENALRFAEKLMFEHNLAEADVRTHQDKPEEMSDGRAATGTRNVNMWESMLSALVVQVIPTVQCYRDHPKVPIGKDGRVAWERGEPVSTPRGGFVFYGPAADVAVAKELFSETRLTIAAMAVARYGSCYQSQGRDYAVGFCEGIEDKIKENLTDRSPKQTAIVLRSTDIVKADAKQWLKDVKGIKTRKTSGSGLYSGTGQGNAQRTGQRDGRAHGLKSGGAGRLGGQKKLGKQ